MFKEGVGVTVGAVSSHGASVYFCQASVSQRRSSSDYCPAWPKVGTFNEKLIRAHRLKAERTNDASVQMINNNPLFYFSLLLSTLLNKMKDAQLLYRK